MQFRLIYQGKLPAASSSDKRSEEKHAIRRVFHPQLLELWTKNPFLKRFVQGHTPKVFPDGEAVSVMSKMAEAYIRSSYRFLPLIRSKLGVMCSLDILFLRRDEPGDLISGGGDIDNRIKVLFDALRVPAENEVRGIPGADEDPLLCLLEDDKLISEIHITTDRLLTPMDGTDHVNDVHLIIRVDTVVTNHNLAWDVF
jgi:hypothetical protein